MSEKGLLKVFLLGFLGLVLNIGLMIGLARATDTFYTVWPFWNIDVTTAGIGYFNGTLLQFGTTTTAPAHVSTAQTTAPVLTSCGTSPTISGTDTAGLVTEGTTSTGCVITFNVAYLATPYCVVASQTAPATSTPSYTLSTTAITITNASTSNEKYNYICVAQAGG